MRPLLGRYLTRDWSREYTGVNSDPLRDKNSGHQRPRDTTANHASSVLQEFPPTVPCRLTPTLVSLRHRGRPGSHERKKQDQGSPRHNRSPGDDPSWSRDRDNTYTPVEAGSSVVVSSFPVW